MKKITCEKAGRLMMLAIYGEADPETEGIMRAHTGSCRECEAELRRLEKLSARVDFRASDDISGELLSKIKARSAPYLPGKRIGKEAGRLILRPVLALVILGLVIFSYSRLKTPEDAVGIAVHEDYEYRMIDERLVQAENSLYAINIELITGFYDF